MAKKHKLKFSRKIIYLVFIVSLVLLMLNLFILSSKKPVEVNTIYTSVTISDRFGFDVNGSSLVFGKIPFGGQATRYLVYHNNNNFPVKLVIRAKGSIAEILEHDEIVNVALNETKRIPFSVKADEKIRYDFYEGYIIVKSYSTD